jgi:hypothetical protein
MKKQEECKKINPLRIIYECFVKRFTGNSKKLCVLEMCYNALLYKSKACFLSKGVFLCYPKNNEENNLLRAYGRKKEDLQLNDAKVEYEMGNALHFMEAYN